MFEKNKNRLKVFPKRELYQTKLRYNYLTFAILSKGKDSVNPLTVIFGPLAGFNKPSLRFAMNGTLWYFNKNISRTHTPLSLTTPLLQKQALSNPTTQI